MNLRQTRVPTLDALEAEATRMPEGAEKDEALKSLAALRAAHSNAERILAVAKKAEDVS